MQVWEQVEYTETGGSTYAVSRHNKYHNKQILHYFAKPKFLNSLSQSSLRVL